MGKPSNSTVIGNNPRAGWLSVWGEHKDGYSTGFRGVVRHSVENSDFASLGVNSINYKNRIDATLNLAKHTAGAFGIGDQVGKELIKSKIDPISINTLSGDTLKYQLQYYKNGYHGGNNAIFRGNESARKQRTIDYLYNTDLDSIAIEIVN
ncbi:MAG: hypothetical protein H6584_08945 [Flavobacteriales bacterium]|nr:hypothetical protein [Flavobacteriales bacterium]